MEGMGSWWAPFQVSGPISLCIESWRVTLDRPSLLLSDHDALTDRGPWSFRSPRPLYSHVHCLRGSNHHSGEWYGGGAACICKFPQTVFSFQWVMNLFSLFEALEHASHMALSLFQNTLGFQCSLAFTPSAPAPLLPYLKILSLYSLNFI